MNMPTSRRPPGSAAPVRNDSVSDPSSPHAEHPDGGSHAELLDRFAGDAVMGTYLIVYIVGHLVAYVLLGVALRRARVVPRWAAWSMVASSPATIAAFAAPGVTYTRAVGFAAMALLVIGSLPAARAMATRHHPPVPRRDHQMASE